MPISHTHRLRRSLLFMPGDSARKIEKSAELNVDSIIADLEDAVALSQKQVARSTIVESFQRIDFGPTERLIRINPVGTPFWQDDLDQTIVAQPDGYVLPKIESAAQVQAVAHRVAALENRHGFQVGGIKLLAQMETAMGVINAVEIAQADNRLDGLLFGAEDLAADMGAQRTKEGWEILYARGAITTVAAAFGLPAIDTVYIDLADTDGLAAECQLARSMGFSGKLAIHPKQVAVINQGFLPSDQEVAYAERVIAGFEREQAAGAGVFELDGRMIDMPIVLAARNIVKTAKR